MRVTGKMLAFVLTLALAAPGVVLPGAALAQSAGDEQYVDPFGDEGQGGGGPGGGNENAQGDGDDGSVPTTSQTAPTDGTAGVADESAVDDGAALPATGLPVAVLALIGLLLLSGGFTLRRRTNASSESSDDGPAAVPEAAIAAAPPAGRLPVRGLALVGLFLLSALLTLRRRA